MYGMDSSHYYHTLTIFITLIGLCYGDGVLPDTLYGAVGGNVTFNTTLAQTSTPSAVIIWTVNSVTLLTFTSGVNNVSPAYQGRVTLNTFTGSLELKNLALNDSGTYTVNIIPVAESIPGSTMLQVLEQVSNVVIKASASDVVEFNSSVSLSCSSSGSSPSYHWLKGSSEVTASDNVQLGDGGSTLTIVNVTRYDQGPWRCNVTNLVSNDISQPSTISVWEKVSDVIINPPSQPIIEGMSVNLTCAAAGNISTIAWMKDGVPLSPSDRVIFSGDNSTVSISPVNRQDSGVYLCRVTNPVSSQVAKNIMIVNYGPDNVTIGGHLIKEVGQKITLRCLNDSTPTANFSWTFNGTEWPGQVSQVFIIEMIQYNDSGIYKCISSNDVTGRSAHAVHTLEVKDEDFFTNDDLLPGEKAGIAIAVLVLVGGAGGLTVYFIKKKDLFNKPSSRGRSASSRAGNINGGGPADQDLNYADVTHFRKKDGGSVQFEHQAVPAESTFNAKVKGRPAPQPGTPRSIYPEDVNYAAVSHSRNKDGGSVQLEHQAAPAESIVYADVRVNGQPTSYTPHLPNSQTKRPAPQPGPPPSIYSKVRKA